MHHPTRDNLLVHSGWSDNRSNSSIFLFGYPNVANTVLGLTKRNICSLPLTEVGEVRS